MSDIKFYELVARIVYFVIFLAVFIQLFSAYRFGVEAWVTTGEFLILSFIYGMSNINK